MKVVIVGSSSSLAKERLQLEASHAEAIIAADGGADALAELKLVPTHLIGDMDSISQETFKYFKNTSEVFQYPVQKNFTDLELAYQKALELGAKSLFVFGWADQRLDFSWNAVLALADYPVGVELVNIDNSVFILNQHHPRLEVESIKKRAISVYRLESPVSLSSQGLFWELKWEQDRVSKSQSNHFKGPAMVLCESGSAFVLLETSEQIGPLKAHYS